MFDKLLIISIGAPLMYNARLTEQIFDGGFCAFFCTKGDSGNLSGAAVCYKFIPTELSSD